MMNNQAESIASSLVREYLSRKGLRTTLQVMDEEMPRTENSISNRQALVKELQIEKLMRKNKLSDQPLRTIMEVILKDLLDKSGINEAVTNGPSPTETKKERLSTFKIPVEQKNHQKLDELSRDDNIDANILAAQSFTKLTGPYTEVELPGSAKHSNDVLQVSSSDMILEDSVEGETVLGSGKAGLIDQNTDKNQNRPRSSKSRGLLGPVTSNVEDQGRRRFHKPRPLSSVNKSHHKKKSDIQTEVNSVSKTSERRTASQNSRLDRLGSSGSFEDSKLDDIETLISKPIVPKSTIEDVLEIDQSRPKTGSSRRQSSSDTNKHYSIQTSSIGNSRPQSRGGNQTSVEKRPVSVPTKSRVGDLEIGDIDDMDAELSALDLGPRLPIGKSLLNAVDSRPIDVKTAMMLKALIFGSASKSFNDEWRYQSFTFCDLPNLAYGIVQKKGGPCGVLAAIQACVLQELLFTENKIPVNRSFDPSHEERSNALAVALSKVIWRAGEYKKAVVTIPSGRPIFSGSSRYRTDDLTETLMLNHFKTLDELTSFVKQCIGQFELDGYSGVILLLYSAVLSRGIEMVKNDMDEAGSKLMGAHNYCTQEMVNLLLTGRAVSNVFNDTVELDSGNGTVLVLKGLNVRSDVGLVSLFEHFKSCQVGTYYKTPKFPIWVVCSESHFSVLFSIKKDLVSDWKAERRFDLFYYDGLARQQEEIKLTIETTNRSYKSPSEDELVPPLELCIRTKWPDAEIDWNGTEPLL